MMEQRTRRQRGSAHDPAQAKMGVDPATITIRDGQMKLRGSWLGQHHIAGGKGGGGGEREHAEVGRIG